jgi:serine/threonine protein kinase
VCKAKWLSKNRHLACKVIEVSGISTASNQLQGSFLLELAAYRELSGPYILRTFGYSTHQSISNPIRGLVNQFMIVMELMTRGSLQNVLDNNAGELSLRRKLTMSRQIASGMRRIHQHGMIHRDIRPDNILVNDKYTAKIGDMGIARVFDPLGKQTQIGCLQFMPPEFFAQTPDGRVKYDEKLDIYTYGLTLNQLFTGTMHDFRLTSPSTKLILKMHSPIFYDDIILPCLENDSKRRPSAVEIEKTLELYEQAFSQTMLTDSYIAMSTNEKDRVFLEFYQTNRSQIQRFINEQLITKSSKDTPIPISKTSSTSNTNAIHDTCRVN